MSTLITDIEAKAHAEIAKIEDASVKEWLTLKTSQWSGKTVLIVAAVAFVAGLLVHLL